MVLACDLGLAGSGAHPAMTVPEKIDFYQHDARREQE